MATTTNIKMAMVLDENLTVLAKAAGVSDTTKIESEFKKLMKKKGKELQDLNCNERKKIVAKGGSWLCLVGKDKSKIGLFCVEKECPERLAYLYLGEMLESLDQFD
jgi:hypothetical protein